MTASPAWTPNDIMPTFNMGNSTHHSNREGADVMVMGTSTSKTSRAAGSAARKYPIRTSPSVGTTNSVTPASHFPNGFTGKAQDTANASRDETFNLEKPDPNFAQSLRSIGPVQPNPTLSHTSAFSRHVNRNTPSRPGGPFAPDPKMNSALAVLEARSKLQEEAEKEFDQVGKGVNGGRQFLDVMVIRQILAQRDQGKSAANIERDMGLKKGVVERLGPRGMVCLVQE